MSSVLAAAEVGLRLGSRWIVRDVSLAVSGGEVVVLVGPNGAGKSTLLKLLAGDLPASTGQILLDGRAIETFRPHELAQRRAVLPQQTVIQFAFTAREVVEMGRLPGRDGDETIVDRSLARTDTSHVAGQVYPSLSIGEQSRVSLARVLAQDTPILLLDEPTAALDFRHQGAVMDLAREAANAGGLVVAVLHDLNLAASTADRIIVLKDGLLIADGSPWEVLTEPILSDVFACPISVTPHPLRDGPLVLPVPGRR